MNEEEGRISFVGLSVEPIRSRPSITDKRVR